MALARKGSNFDRLARIYRWLEYIVFGGALQRCRLAFLPAMQRSRRVLVVGDGDGRFLVELVRTRTSSPNHLISESLNRLDAIDSSPAMVNEAKRRLAPWVQGQGGPAFQVCPISQAALQGPYDLIVTHFFLDCFSEDELAGIVARLAAAAGPRAQWVVSEFSLPERGFVRWLAKSLLWLMYRFFHWTTGLGARLLPDYAACLRAAGFHLKERHSTVLGLLRSELWEYG